MMEITGSRSMGNAQPRRDDVLLLCSHISALRKAVFRFQPRQLSSPGSGAPSTANAYTSGRHYAVLAILQNACHAVSSLRHSSKSYSVLAIALHVTTRPFPRKAVVLGFTRRCFALWYLCVQGRALLERLQSPTRQLAFCSLG